MSDERLRVAVRKRRSFVSWAFLIAILELASPVSAASTNFPWASWTADEFLQRLEAIALHGDLRDLRFVESMLGIKFQVREKFYPVGNHRELGEVQYEPIGNFRSYTPYPIYYSLITGRVPIFSFLERPLLSSLQFAGLENYVCIRSENVQQIFENKYPRLNMGIQIPPRYGYNLFSGDKFGINFEVFPASPESSDCIRYVELYQSEWTDAVPADRTSP